MGGENVLGMIGLWRIFGIGDNPVWVVLEEHELIEAVTDGLRVHI